MDNNLATIRALDKKIRQSGKDAYVLLMALDNIACPISLGNKNEWLNKVRQSVILFQERLFPNLSEDERKIFAGIILGRVKEIVSFGKQSEVKLANGEKENNENAGS